ncbi:MAG: TVP38/TMEM64 family protein [Candidatus Hodarchaeales archaeon]
MENEKDSVVKNKGYIPSFKSKIKNLIFAFKRSFEGHTRYTWVWIIFFFLILVISGIVLYFQYQDETWLFDKVIRHFVMPIIELGIFGMLIFIIFMGIQGIVVPIPSELVLLTSGLIWGVVGGSIIGIVGSMVAGTITYYVAVLGGRPVIEKFLGQENLEIIDSYIKKHGLWAIIFARAFPFMAFDPISYASGFLKVKFRDYTIATLIGSVIRCVFYAWLGSTLVTQEDISQWLKDPAKYQQFIDQYSSNFNSVLFMLVLILGLAFLVYQFLLMPYLKKKSGILNKES